MVATITSDADEYAKEVVAALMAMGIRAETDLRNEKINYKVREHSLAKVPVMAVVGKQRPTERTVALRTLGRRETGVPVTRRRRFGQLHANMAASPEPVRAT